MTEERIGTFGAPGMRTGDKSGGGRDPDYSQPIDNTRSRMRRRAAEALWLALGVPLLVGPWVLVVYVPLFAERALVTLGDWFGFEVEVNRVSMAMFGVLVGLLLIVAPDWLLLWWPFPWQRAASSWRGLYWPRRFPGVVALVLFLRTLPILVSLKMWPEVWYLDQRQRQETVDPTRSSMAYDTVEPSRVQYPGIHNPYQVPGAEPETPIETVRTFRVEHVPTEPEPARVLAQSAETGAPSLAAGGTGGNGHRRIVEMPVGLLGDNEHDALRRIQAVAYGTLEDGRPWSRPEWAGRGQPFTASEWRTLNAWLVERGLVRKTGAAHNDPHEWTRGGEFWLRAFLDG